MTDGPANLTSHEPEDSHQRISIPVRVVKNEEPIRVTDRRSWAQDQSTATDTLESANYSFKPTYVEELEKKLGESQRKVEEVLASYREHKVGTVAETQRVRERIQNEYNRRLSQAKTYIVKKFIDVLENFDRTLVAAISKPACDSLFAIIY